MTPSKYMKFIKQPSPVGMAGVACATILAAFPLTAGAHTISWGFEPKGKASIVVWGGTYHDPSESPTTQGNLLLERVGGGFSKSIPFNIQVAVKPDGLKDGKTNFYANNSGGTDLKSTNTTGLDVMAWQGVQVSGLKPGKYRFSYDPAVVIPSAKWAPWDASIQGGGIIKISKKDLGITPPPPPPPPTSFVINLFDTDAIFSLFESGLPLALAQREVIFNAAYTATRDVNGRLFRLRAGIRNDLDPVAENAPMDGGKTGSYASDGKSYAGGKQYKEYKGTSEPSTFKRFELFASGDFNRFDVDDVGDMRGFNSDVYAGTVGFEYRIVENIAIGLAGTYLEANTDIGRNIGGIDIDGVAVSAYATGVWNGFYADALYSYSVFAEEVERYTLVGRKALGDTESRNHVAQLNLGYNFTCGDLQTGPIGSLQYTNGSVDGYNERDGGSANIHFRGQSYDSLISRIGWQVSYRIPAGSFTITPQVRATWDHEYLDETESVSARLEDSPFTTITPLGVTTGNRFSASAKTARPGNDFLNLGAGLLAQIGDDVSIIAEYETHLFRDDASAHIASLKASVAF
jgi:uncharacterized protein YhjY with autotransporter beta-barrel domain